MGTPNPEKGVERSGDDDTRHRRFELNPEKGVERLCGGKLHGIPICSRIPKRELKALSTTSTIRTENPLRNPEKGVESRPEFRSLAHRYHQNPEKGVERFMELDASQVFGSNPEKGVERILLAKRRNRAYENESRKGS